MKGYISIGKYLNMDVVHLTIEDDASGTRFLDVEMRVKDFALAVMNQSDMPCEFNLTSDYVGKIRKIKTEKISVPVSDYKRREENAKNAVAPYEVDGWMGRWEDCLNSHNVVKGTSNGKSTVYEVSFIRYVDAEDK